MDIDFIIRAVVIVSILLSPSFYVLILSIHHALSRVRLLATLWVVACQTPLCIGFFRQEYQSGWPCPPPEDLPNLGIEPTSLVTPALQADSLSLILHGYFVEN